MSVNDGSTNSGGNSGTSSNRRIDNNTSAFYSRYLRYLLPYRIGMSAKEKKSKEEARKKNYTLAPTISFPSYSDRNKEFLTFRLALQFFVSFYICHSICVNAFVPDEVLLNGQTCPQIPLTCFFPFLDLFYGSRT